MTIRFLQLLAIFAATACAASIGNSDVVRMVRQGFPTAEIVSRINGSESKFTLYPEDVNKLRKQGVTEIIIQSMYARQTRERLDISTITQKPAANPAPRAAIPAPETVPAPGPASMVPPNPNSPLNIPMSTASVPTSVVQTSTQAIGVVTSTRPRTDEASHFVPEIESLERLTAVFGHLVKTSSFVGAVGAAWQPRQPFLGRDSNVNAYSTGDGVILVTDGLMQGIQGDRGMLAFILGHEMAHNQLQHHLRDYNRAVERQRMIRYYNYRCRVGGKVSCIADAAYQAASLIAEQKIKRDEENAADYLGMMAAAEAGYHPDYSIMAARRLRALTGESSKFATFFADHPRWTTREERAERHYDDAVARFNQFWQTVDASPGGRPPAFAEVSGTKIDKNKNEHSLHAAIKLHNMRYATANLTILLTGEYGAPQITVLQKEVVEAPQFEDVTVIIPTSSTGRYKGKKYVSIEIVSGPDRLYFSGPIKIN